MAFSGCNGLSSIIWIFLKPQILVVYANSRQKKNRLSYDRKAPKWRWQSFHRRFRGSNHTITALDQRAHQTVTFSESNGLASITWESSELWIRQFYLLTYLPGVKCASSLKKILFENCRPRIVVQAAIPRIYDVVNCQLASVLAWSGLYMDVRVYLNAKYATMCPNTVFGNTFTYNSDIFRGTSETMMERAFNVCNHSRLFKFLYDFERLCKS